MEQFQVKGRTLVIRMPKEQDHHTTGQIPGIADRMIGEKNILSMKDYENQLEALRQGDTVTVTVQRKSVNEYKELEYQVNVGAR